MLYGGYVSYSVTYVMLYGGYVPSYVTSVMPFFNVSEYIFISLILYTFYTPFSVSMILPKNLSITQNTRELWFLKV